MKQPGAAPPAGSGRTRRTDARRDTPEGTQPVTVAPSLNPVERFRAGIGLTYVLDP